MNVQYSWLKSYIPRLPTATALVDLLAYHGLEVDQLIDRRTDFARVVVGEVMAVRPHPNADAVRLADVRMKPNGPTQEIVCGAPNLAVGQKVPVAQIGAKLPNGLTIERRTIRGVVSEGMLCAEDELGLGTSHAGLLVLPPETKIGTPLATALGLDEIIFDLAIPANRADLFSIRGLVREIAAIVNRPIVWPKSAPVRPSRAVPLVQLGKSDSRHTLALAVRRVSGVTMRPTPEYIVRRLRSAGIRPVNIVVDCTNYIMVEYGQPLHAYDANTVQGALRARLATPGETIMTLDGQKRLLSSSMLVIADAQAAVGIAGVMGGQATEVSGTTTEVILEAGVFDPVVTRRTARSLGLQSEASKRFEKGLWPELPAEALEAVTRLLLEVAGGMAGPVTHIGKKTSPVRTIAIHLNSVVDRLGWPIAASGIKKMWTALGFTVSAGTTARVRVPAWRLDVQEPEDLIDEIGRLSGYQSVPADWPTVATIPDGLPLLVDLKDKIADVLVSSGATEIISHAYYGQADQQQVGGPHFAVANPLDKTQQFLRRSIVPRIHDVLRQSVDAGRDALVFELGRVFQPHAHRPLESQQPWSLAIGHAARVSATSHAPGSELLALIQELHRITGLPLPPTTQIGSATEKGRVMSWVEIPLDRPDVTTRTTAKVPDVFPGVRRTITMIIPDNVPFNKVLGSMLRQLGAKQQLLREHVAWISSHDNTPRLSIDLLFGAPDRTLTKAEADELEQAARRGLAEAGAKVLA